MEFTLKYVPVPGATEEDDGEAMVEIFVSLQNYDNFPFLPIHHFIILG